MAPLALSRSFSAQPSLSAAFHSILGLKDFLPSGYPYRGELWGIWTQVVYLNQRHFASAVGIFLVVLLFLLDRYRQHAAAKVAAIAPEALIGPIGPYETYAEICSRQTPLQAIPLLHTTPRSSASNLVVFDKSFLFAGCLLGLLPFWNALVFTAAFAILAGLFVLFPCRRQMVGLGLMAGLVALPQLALLEVWRGTNAHSFVAALGLYHRPAHLVECHPLHRIFISA